MAETVFAATQTDLGERVKSVSISTSALRDGEIRRVEDETPDATEFLSAGKPIPGLQVRIQPPARASSDAGVLGEIVIAGSCLCSGYYALPEVTLERFRADEYYTRDLGFIMDGELFVVGRKDDLIISNGRNYYAHEIEAAVSALPGVKGGRVIAFGIDNAQTGSKDVMLLLETEDGSRDPAQLRRQIKEMIMQTMGVMIRTPVLVPRGWLVKTTSGKISREMNARKYCTESGLPVSVI